jgi:hypothetical protein
MNAQPLTTAEMIIAKSREVLAKNWPNRSNWIARMMVRGAIDNIRYARRHKREGYL